MSTRIFYPALLFAALAVSSLTARDGLFDDEEARKDIKNLRAQVEAQSRDTEGRLQKLDESIKNLGIIQLLNQIDQLNVKSPSCAGRSK